MRKIAINLETQKRNASRSLPVIVLINIHLWLRNTIDLQCKIYKYIYMKGVKNLKLKNYLNTICSKNHNIHEFDNVLGLGIKDVYYVCGLVDKNF
jgi:hypothetical protein